MKYRKKKKENKKSETNTRTKQKNQFLTLDFDKILRDHLVYFWLYLIGHKNNHFKIIKKPSQRNDKTSRVLIKLARNT